GQGDECLFIHFGSGVCNTLLGTVKFGPKDYVVIPKGVTYQMVFDKRDSGASVPPADGGPPAAQMPYGKFLVIETCNGSHIGPPPRYIAKSTSQFLEHSPYCERDLRLPDLPLTFDQKGDFEVRI